MILVTSINPDPSTRERQRFCIDTWKRYGYPMISINSQDEIDRIQGFDDIKFIVSDRDARSVFGKPTVFIYDILNIASKHTDDIIVIINSDIELRSPRMIFQRLMRNAFNSLIVISRVDYSDTMSKVHEGGYDIFMFHKKFVSMFSDNIYAIGQPFWDYWLPFTFRKNNKAIFWVRGKIGYHLIHKQAWSSKSWYMCGEVLKKESGINKEVNNGFSKAIRRYFIKGMRHLNLDTI